MFISKNNKRAALFGTYYYPNDASSDEHDLNLLHSKTKNNGWLNELNVSHTGPIA